MSSSHVNQIGSLTSLSGNIQPHSATPLILDSGVIDHVSSSLTHFTSFQAIKPLLVKLPTGQHVYATHSGNIHFCHSFHLTNVLYIPSFTFNLISISKLLSSLHCELIFSHNSCIIQDLNNK